MNGILYRLYRYPILIGGANLKSFPNNEDDCGVRDDDTLDNIDNSICDENGNIIYPYSAYVGNDFDDNGFDEFNGLAIYAIPEKEPYKINYYPAADPFDSVRYFCGTPPDKRTDSDFIRYHHPCLVGTNDEAIRLHNWRSSSFYGPYADNVISAGEIFKRDNYIFINNMSGHYKPDLHSLIHAYGLIKNINPDYKIHILGSTGRMMDFINQNDINDLIEEITNEYEPNYEIKYLDYELIDDFIIDEQ